MPGRPELKCKTFPFGTLPDLKFVVVCSFYQGNYLLSKHKKRDTWETQGGHIEPGETALAAAKRELFEESGVIDADLYPVCDYLGYDDTGSANGAVFLADIHQLGTLPESEMKEVQLFAALPEELTYPHVTPRLMEQAKLVLHSTERRLPMTHETMIRLALEEGFSAAAVIPTGQIVFDSSFRPYCEQNLCGKYGINYTCPPDCGSPKEMKQRVLAHRYALVLQTIWDIPDWNDSAKIKQAKASHNSGELRLAKLFRAEGHEGLMVGASGCSLCSPCAITLGEPCRYPDLKYSCMSAYCIYVKKLAEDCGMSYDYKDGKLPFFGMYVFD